MKYCEHCGKAISDNAAFCSGCGKSCQSAAPARTFCENCGRPLEAGQRFCQGCGKPVGSMPVPVAPVQPVPVTPVQPVPTAPVPMFCENCGHPLVAGRRFCFSCGTPVSSAVPVQTVPVQSVAHQPVTQLDTHQTIPQPIPQPAPQPVYPVPVQPVQPEYNTPAPVTAKKRKMPKWVMAVTAVVLVAAIGLGIFALCGGFIKRAEFPKPPTEESVTEFMAVVLENANNAYDIKDFLFSDRDGFSGNMVFALKNNTLNEAHTSGSFSLQSSVELQRYSISTTLYGRLPGCDIEGAAHEESYELTRDIIIALEKTLCGQSRAEEVLKEYNEMQEFAVRHMQIGYNDGVTQWSSYQLDEKTSVIIYFQDSEESLSAATSWCVSYILRFHP